MPEILLHLLTPHHTNNHRARVLHLDALLFYALAFSVFHLGMQYVYRNFPDVLGYATDIHVEQLLTETNAKRTAAELPALTLNQSLSAAAAKKAEDMFARGYWAHQSPDGKSPWDFIVNAGYKYIVAGENLAKNFSTSRAVVDAWMASSNHKDNIVKPQYRDIGFAVVNGVLNGEETTLVVQMFGSTNQSLASVVPQVQAAPATAPAPTKAPEPAPKPVELTEVASSVALKPLFDIPTVSRTIVVGFVGFMLGVLAVDAWIVGRRRIVRVVGHNAGHILFLGSLLIAMNALLPGSVL